MSKTAFIFPGQGAQYVGMTADLMGFPQARSFFDRGSEILGYDIAGLCQNGPEEKLNSTVFSQPAIFVVSAALLESFRAACPDIRADITAGLSMGEYTALYAAGALGFEDALALVSRRGRAMQAAADASDGSMVSVIGLDEDKMNQLCSEASEGQMLLAANFNCPGQIVISGQRDACLRAAEIAPKYGAIKAVPLAVAGAFHTEMMTPAAKDLKTALDKAPIKNPDKIRVIANISGEYYTSADDIRQGLVKQLVQPILWEKCIRRLICDGVGRFYEIGPGRVLTGLLKRIDRKANVVNVSSVESLDRLKSDRL